MSPTPRARLLRDLRTTLICLAFAFIVGAGTYYLVQRGEDQVASAHNPLVCVLRKYIAASRARADFTAKHAPTALARATARQSRASSDDLLAHLLTIPRHYRCPS